MKPKDNTCTRRFQDSLRISALFVCIVTLLAVSCRHSSPDTIIPFRETIVSKADIEVEDGDTFSWRGQRVRMLGIDCAEKASPHHSGDQEPWGSRAEEFLRQQISAANTLSVVRIEKPDRYGRWLAYLLADGENVNARVIGAGLAYETVSHYGKQGLERYANECLEAARTAPKPQFELPSEFRQRNRKK